MNTTRIARVPFSSAVTTPLADPYQLDPDAIIKPAENFTVSINTVSQQLFTKYREIYNAGHDDNDYFILLSKFGIGDQAQPTTKMHLLEPIDKMTTDHTSIWAENVLVVEDYHAKEASDDLIKSQRLFLSFQSFCQSIDGDDKYEKLTKAGNDVLSRAGLLFPTLMPFTTVGGEIIKGLGYILGKLSNHPGECKQESFNLYPQVENRQIQGEAPLQEGCYVFFFEDTDVSGLYLDSQGRVCALNNQTVSPYLVVNIKRGACLAPDKISTSAAAKVLKQYEGFEGYSRPEGNFDSEGFFNTLKEFGDAYKYAEYIQRYYQLKAKGTQLTPEEAKRFEDLKSLLGKRYPAWDSKDPLLA